MPIAHIADHYETLGDVAEAEGNRALAEVYWMRAILAWEEGR